MPDWFGCFFSDTANVVFCFKNPIPFYYLQTTNSHLIHSDKFTTFKIDSWINQSFQRAHNQRINNQRANQKVLFIQPLSLFIQHTLFSHSLFSHSLTHTWRRMGAMECAKSSSNLSCEAAGLCSAYDECARYMWVIREVMHVYVWFTLIYLLQLCECLCVPFSLHFIGLL